MLVTMVIDDVEVPEVPDAADPATQLLEQTADGGDTAFASLYDMLAARAFGLILRVLVDRAQSEEVLQDVFLEVWQTAAKFDSARGGARAWILTIAHRRAVDRVRASHSSTQRDLRIGVRDFRGETTSVEEHAQLRIDGGRATEALRTLPDAQREALVLAYFGGFTQREITAITGAPLGTVKTRMRDGLTRLRKALEG
ncbi:MAG TPA: sigma-70 family RNA polymerase sigma factor [Candidatus Agrococcus pullicola]|uniref:RNA polymerase sigma factor n=1 Tax=Candidatus Agrococcus pullicola TaxID=2838429 RepID=A0A9D1YTJ5_9MICO|nr:sigma-70 family RNA polymerase sigma factor [Candidatus Agrococcus pullicola]